MKIGVRIDAKGRPGGDDGRDAKTGLPIASVVAEKVHGSLITRRGGNSADEEDDDRTATADNEEETKGSVAADCACRTKFAMASDDDDGAAASAVLVRANMFDSCGVPVGADR
jgi:hypothetical protein